MDRNQRQRKDNQSLNEHFFHHESDAQSLSEEELLAQKQKEIRFLGHIPEEDNTTNRCPICRNDITGRAVTDTCAHAFCFNCLREWSRTKNRCPNCRTEFRNIFYNIQDNGEHNTLEVTPQTLGPQPGERLIRRPDLGFRFGFGFRRRRRRGRGRHNLTPEQSRQHRRDARLRNSKGSGRRRLYQTAYQTRIGKRGRIRRTKRSGTRRRRTRTRRRRRRFH